MFLCVCKGVSEKHIRNALNEGACAMRHLRCKTGLGTQCGVCRKTVKQYIHEVTQVTQPDKTTAVDTANSLHL